MISGKKDDLLGEVIVPVKDLLAAPVEGMTFDLRRKGKEEKGNVTLYAREIQHSHGEKMLLVRVVSATGLRKADMFGKNDVYVQMFSIPEDTPSDKPIPETRKNCVLPPGDLVVPFVFRIPSKQMPSSYEAGFEDSSYVRYSLYGNVDIAWWRDPSTRFFITVMSTELPPPTAMCPALRPPAEPQAIYGWDCCCQCCPQGTAQFEAAVDRTCVSPGDVIHVALNAQNHLQKDMRFKVEIKTCSRLESFTLRGTATHERVTPLDEAIVPAGGQLVWASASPKPLKIPGLPPTFGGNFLGRRSGKDPVTWHHVLVMTLEGMGIMGTEITWKFPLFIGAMPAAVVQIVQPADLATVQQPEWMEGQELAKPVNFPGAPDNSVLVVQAQVVDFLPQQVHSLTAKTVPALQTGAVDGFEHEDDNHFGDPVVFAPLYPKPENPTPVLGTMPTLGGMAKEQDGAQTAPGQQTMG
mmetsp:Transcript_116424/g.267282  ORF Transcript_116424/g.267282 Transcript_116424/m.267282 type:complete len:466 (-) Transcript_116424:100-1497(-)